jgi:hypothetical protein
MYNIWPTDNHLFCQVAVPVEPELKKVREYKVGECASVSLQLIRILYPVKVFDSRRLCLNISYDMLFPVPQAEIRVSRVGLFRDSGDLDIFFINGFCIFVKEGFKGGIKAFFPGVSTLGDLMDLFKIRFQHPAHLILFFYSGYFFIQSSFQSSGLLSSNNVAY